MTHKDLRYGTWSLECRRTGGITGTQTSKKQDNTDLKYTGSNEGVRNRKEAQLGIIRDEARGKQN